MNNDSPNNPKKNDILVVDDTPDNIRFLSTMLTEQGYNVRKAINGQMALTAVQAVLPDLILLDINMPGLDGYEVCKQLKQNEKTNPVPVIFLSALDDTEDKIKAFKVGGVDYITKPFHFEEVLARIKNQLTIKQLQSQLKEQNQQLKETLTELKSAQAQLIHKEKMVSLGKLVAGISHQLNNPISFIAGNLDFTRNYIQDLLQLIKIYQQEYPQPTEIIKEAIQEIDLEFISADLEKVLGSIQAGSERISTIILALRIFSRLNESEIKSVDIHQGIDSSLLLLQHRINQQDKDLEIEVIKNYSELPKVTCYASQLNQVFLNLLNNAVDALESKFTKGFPETTKPTIWIDTELDDRTSVLVRIKDNGCGISEEVKAHLFEPFFTTQPGGKGSGLGLLTSYQIVVEKHNGKLSFNSQVGQGAEFIVEIPIELVKLSSSRSPNA
ncbi:MAG: hybrid sensor histidine kinase/response regulator [Oscillatoria sp. PMC 1051.18]|nr:hybrid sensor histidine kinase/response regulator [Oscillatoria sp. PMC 1050.18]MEC5031592.1 hybrid sensor histidine kinase/response regulator [Oscillatoria sp. PMC 1051.18]